MTDPELPGMEDLPRNPPKPKPRYRVTLKVRQEGKVEFETDGDPNAFLEDDDNAELLIDDFMTWGRGTEWLDTDWGYDVEQWIDGKWVRLK